MKIKYGHVCAPYIYKDKDLDPTIHPDFVAIDTECTGLQWAKEHQPFAISLAWKQDNELKTAFYAWPVDPYSRKVNYKEKWSFNCFLSWYRNSKIPKVFANAKYDIHMIEKNLVWKPLGPIYDVLIAAWCCNTLEESYGLNNLCEKYGNIDQSDEVALAKETKSLRLKMAKLGWSCGPEHVDNYRQDYWILREHDHTNTTLEKYALKDAVRTHELWDMYKEGMKELGVRKTFNTEMRVADVIYKMEKRGINFLKENCEAKLNECEHLKEKCEAHIKLAFQDPNLNINSDAQLRKYLYGPDGLSLPVKKLTKKSKQPSVDGPTLLHYKDNPIVKNILMYRGYEKGIKTCNNYLKRFVQDGNTAWYNMFDQKYCYAVHPSFNQIATNFDKDNKTKTGRLTSSNPNLQNVADPAKSGGFFTIDERSFFGPRFGYLWLLIDYSQLELRIFAERCGGKLKQAYVDGRDVHNETRLNVPFLAAMDEKKGRKIAKNTNFTIANAGGPNVLREKYGIPYEEGKQIHTELNTAFPEIKRRQYEAMDFAIKHGYIETLTGRKINIDLTRDSDGGRYLYAYRATAYDIQGSAADFIKLAMIECDNYCKELREQKNIDAHLVLSVHDELVFEIEEKSFQRAIARNLVRRMVKVAKPYMDISLQCEAEITTKTWSSEDKKEFEL